MPNDPLAAVATRPGLVPQSQPVDPAQVENHAGGYTYETAWEQRLLRFLILGTTGGTFYASESEHTAEATGDVRGIIDAHGAEAVRLIVDVSVAGRAPRQNPTLWALAYACASRDEATRRAALDAIPAVCRTGTMLFLFVRYAEQHRGWGKGLQRAIARWYTDPPVEDVAYQIVKYGQREGLSHRDLLRLSKPGAGRREYDTADERDTTRRALFSWAAGNDAHLSDLPRIVQGAFAATHATTDAALARTVAEYRLPWEALPSERLNSREVWEALLPSLGATALIRQLPRLTRLGLCDAGAERSMLVGRLVDEEFLRRGRVHPIAILNALMGYRTGQARSGGEFRPVPQIVDALDDAFYRAFGAVEPVGGPVLLALDVSPSMFGAKIAGTNLTAGHAAAALALVTAATERDYEIIAFASADAYAARAGFAGRGRGVIELPLSPRQRLDDVVQSMNGITWGGTDCALPYLYALKEQRPVDLFVTLTDNETWAGDVHPHVALSNYRDRMSRPRAGGVVVGMTATRFSVADPSDPRMLDVVGFDLATPHLISAFGRGEV